MICYVAPLQATELLGLGLPSLYLAAVMLDCCWVEEGMRVRHGAAAADSALSYEAEAGPLPSLSGERLQVTALACVLHAFRCAATPSARYVGRRTLWEVCMAVCSQ